jgi:hypothetical protein
MIFAKSTCTCMVIFTFMVVVHVGAITGRPATAVKRAVWFGAVATRTGQSNAGDSVSVSLDCERPNLTRGACRSLPRSEILSFVESVWLFAYL